MSVTFRSSNTGKFFGSSRVQPNNSIDLSKAIDLLPSKLYSNIGSIRNEDRLTFKLYYNKHENTLTLCDFESKNDIYVLTKSNSNTVYVTSSMKFKELQSGFLMKSEPSNPNVKKEDPHRDCRISFDPIFYKIIAACSTHFGMNLVDQELAYSGMDMRVLQPVRKYDYTRIIPKKFPTSQQLPYILKLTSSNGVDKVGYLWKRLIDNQVSKDPKVNTIEHVWRGGWEFVLSTEPLHPIATFQLAQGKKIGTLDINFTNSHNIPKATLTYIILSTFGQIFFDTFRKANVYEIYQAN